MHIPYIIRPMLQTGNEMLIWNYILFSKYYFQFSAVAMVLFYTSKLRFLISYLISLPLKSLSILHTN
jgi:hypothetical protein